MLTLTLRALERDGCHPHRASDRSAQRRVRLDELGLSLRVPVQALGEWALLNQHTMADARRRFDVAAART